MNSPTRPQLMHWTVAERDRRVQTVTGVFPCSLSSGRFAGVATMARGIDSGPGMLTEGNTSLLDRSVTQSRTRLRR